MELEKAETNKLIVRRFLEDSWSKPDLELVDKLVSPSISMRNFPFFSNGIQGTESVKRLIANVRSVIPDLWIKIIDMVAEDDKVAVHWTSGGTQRGRWEEAIPPTGNQVSWNGIDFYRIVDGKIAELIEVEDGLSLLHQIQALQTWKPH